MASTGKDDAASSEQKNGANAPSEETQQREDQGRSFNFFGFFGSKNQGSGDSTPQLKDEDDVNDGDKKPAAKQSSAPKTEDVIVPFVTMEEAIYSKQRMQKALKKLRPFLEPEPALDETGEIDSVLDRNFFVKDGESAAAVVKLMRSDSKYLLSPEFKLLTIAALRNSCVRNNKEFTTALLEEGSEDVVLGALIMDQWKHQACKNLEQLAKTDAAQEKNWFHAVTASFLILEILRLVSECLNTTKKEQLSDKNKQLIAANGKYGLEWNQGDYLNDVKACANTIGMDAIVKACDELKGRLSVIRFSRDYVPYSSRSRPSPGAARRAPPPPFLRAQRQQRFARREEERRREARHAAFDLHRMRARAEFNNGNVAGRDVVEARHNNEGADAQQRNEGIARNNNNEAVADNERPGQGGDDAYVERDPRMLHFLSLSREMHEEMHEGQARRNVIIVGNAAAPNVANVAAGNNDRPGHGGGGDGGDRAEPSRRNVGSEASGNAARSDESEATDNIAARDDTNEGSEDNARNDSTEALGNAARRDNVAARNDNNKASGNAARNVTNETSGNAARNGNNEAAGNNERPGQVNNAAEEEARAFRARAEMFRAFGAGLPGPLDDLEMLFDDLEELARPSLYELGAAPPRNNAEDEDDDFSAAVARVAAPYVGDRRRVELARSLRNEEDRATALALELFREEEEFLMGPRERRRMMLARTNARAGRPGPFDPLNLERNRRFDLADDLFALEVGDPIVRAGAAARAPAPPARPRVSRRPEYVPPHLTELRALEQAAKLKPFSVCEGLELVQPSPEFDAEQILIKRVTACIGWAVHGLIFELVDGSRMGTLLVNPGERPMALNDKKLSDRACVGWTDIEYGDYVVGMHGHNLAPGVQKWFCYALTLTFASGKTVHYEANHEPWRGAPFSFEVPRTHPCFVYRISFKNDQKEDMLGIVTSIHLPMSRANFAHLPRKQQQAVGEMLEIGKQVDMKLEYNGAKPMGEDVWWLILGFLRGWELLPPSINAKGTKDGQRLFDLYTRRNEYRQASY